jgi:hypothetical protein
LPLRATWPNTDILQSPCRLAGLRPERRPERGRNEGPKRGRNGDILQSPCRLAGLDNALVAGWLRRPPIQERSRTP